MTDDPRQRFLRARGGQIPSVAAVATTTGFDYGLVKLAGLYSVPKQRTKIGLADDLGQQLEGAATILRPLGVEFVPIRLQGDQTSLESVVERAKGEGVLVLLVDHNFKGGNGIEYAKRIFVDCQDVGPQDFLHPVVYSAVDRATADIELQRRFPHLSFISKNQEEELIRVLVQREFVRGVLAYHQRQTLTSYQQSVANLGREIQRLTEQLRQASVSTPLELAEPERPISRPEYVGLAGEYRTPQLARELTDRLLRECVYFQDTQPRNLTADRIRIDWDEDLRAELGLLDIASAYRIVPGATPERDIGKPLAFFVEDVEKIAETAARMRAEAAGLPAPSLHKPTVARYHLRFTPADHATYAEKGKGTDLDLSVSILLPLEGGAEVTKLVQRAPATKYERYVTENLDAKVFQRQYPGEGEFQGSYVFEVTARFPGVYEDLSGVEVAKTEPPPTTATVQRDMLGRVGLVKVPSASYLGGGQPRRQ